MFQTLNILFFQAFFVDLSSHLLAALILFLAQNKVWDSLVKEYESIHAQQVQRWDRSHLHLKI